MDTALDQIQTIYKGKIDFVRVSLLFTFLMLFFSPLKFSAANKANFKSAVGRAMIGTRIITQYNNRTYPIDDILWDLNPDSTFPDRVRKLFLANCVNISTIIYFFL